MALDRRLGQSETRGDLAVAEGLGDQAEHLTFPVRELPLLRPVPDSLLGPVPGGLQALLGNAQDDPGAISVHGADGNHQFLPLNGLQQVGPDAGRERCLHQSGPLVHAQDDDP